MKQYPLFPQLPRTLRTVSHLRREQIVYRLWYAVRRRLPVSLWWRGCVAWGPLRFTPLCPVIPFPSRPPASPTDIDRGRFRFLNDTVDFGGLPRWAAPGKSRLWRYNLHYFQYLNEGGRPDRERALRLMEHWVRENPPGTPDAWDPFPISLRLVNWVKYLSACDTCGPRVDFVLRSAYHQALWLEDSLEYHLLANHLFKNAKALIFAGLFFRGKDAARWLALGLEILHRELSEQVLPDGGHFERSPMYHSMILEDCLDLLNLLRGSPDAGKEAPGEPRIRALFEARLHETARRMIGFLRGVVHPDGEIPLFNDAAFGIEAPPDHLFRFGGMLGVNGSADLPPTLRSFPHSGYFVMAPREGDQLIVDCGPVGPDYQPGHAHCDTLSFELSLGGRRVVVDSGCCQYEDGAMRRYNRGNRGHNGVTVDHRDQSEVWGAHRCGNRARPLYGNLTRRDDGALVFEGAHDGYRLLNGSPVHHRRIVWASEGITVEDFLEGSGTHHVESRIHLHPDCAVESQAGVVRVAADHGVSVLFSTDGDRRIECHRGWYCPRFGVRQGCTVLTVSHPAATLPRRFRWTIALR